MEPSTERIIAASKGDNPSEDLENFWLELAESSIKIIPDFYTLDYDCKNYSMVMVKSPSVSLNSTFFGVPKFFIPRWFRPIVDINEFPQDWTYLYDNTPLAKTIEKYVDFKKLSPGSLFADQDNDPRTIRLIVTVANVLTAEPIVFDSEKFK